MLFPPLVVTSPSHNNVSKWDGTKWDVLPALNPMGLSRDDSGHWALVSAGDLVIFDSAWSELGRIRLPNGAPHEVRWTRDGWVVCCSLSGALTQVGWLSDPVNLFEESLTWVNGVACVNGVAAFVSAPAGWSSSQGWRQGEPDSAGFIADVRSGVKVCEGLIWPHSPRWHDGAVWFVQSGTGELCRWNVGTASFDVVSKMSGIPRGLAWCDSLNVWLVGCSQYRPGGRIQGDPLQPAGVAAVDISGVQVGWLPVDVNEIFDVVVL